jgi:predicted  nucleic acid-binding Zn-ribbon protein
MRHLPFKVLILCVLLPPMVYVFSVQFLEKAIQTHYARELAASYLGDTRPLFDGSLRLEDAIKHHVEAFLGSRHLRLWGLRVTVTVKTRDGVYLYPEAYANPGADLDAMDNIAVARENFRLLDEGLIRTVNVQIENSGLISILILSTCVISALLVLFWFYRRGLKMSREEERVRQAMIDGLAGERRESLKKLERLETQRADLSQNIDAMKKQLAAERQKVSAAEDEMIDELVALEDRISEGITQRDLQQQEIEALKKQIQQFEKENEAKNRQLSKEVDAIRKRFATLYKNLAVHDRAIEGFVELTEEMKIKAEEVVHQLNQDLKLVQIKRKVFGKKNRQTVFEVIFAYKGRLYFRNTTGNRAEIVVIGTKLTQNKDLAFLDKL